MRLRRGDTLRADWHPADADAPIEPIVEPLTMRADVTVRIVWPSAESPRQPPRLHVDGGATLSACKVFCSAAHISHIVRTLRVLTHPEVARARHARRRQQAAESSDTFLPRRRWHHAVDAILSELRKERQQLSWRWLHARILLLRAYKAALAAHRGSDQTGLPATVTPAIEKAAAAMDVATADENDSRRDHAARAHDDPLAWLRARRCQNRESVP